MRNLKTLAVLSFLLGANNLSYQSFAQANNPFETGTRETHLTPEKIQSLSLLINQSKVDLEQALAYGKGRTAESEVEIYLAAVKKVVIRSNTQFPTTELLMRVILNQTMALTTGVPTADGNGVVSPGILAQTSYADLMAAIFRQSIATALAYVDQDMKAVEQDALFNLPYAEVALVKLIQADYWSRSVIGLRTAAQFSQTALQHWLNTMMITENLSESKYAADFIYVDNALKEIQTLKTQNPRTLDGRRARVARIATRKTISSMNANIATEEYHQRVQPLLNSMNELSLKAAPQVVHSQDRQKAEACFELASKIPNGSDEISAKVSCFSNLFHQLSKNDCFDLASKIPSGRDALRAQVSCFDHFFDQFSKNECFDYASRISSGREENAAKVLCFNKAQGL